MQQYIRHSKTAKHRNRITDNEWETLSVIKNPELNKHRRLFLGEPGSKKWKEYYAGLLKTKRALFNEESLQDKEEKIERLTKRNTRKNIVGGGGVEDLVDILTTVVNAMGGNKSTPNDTQFEVAAAVAAAANGNPDNTLIDITQLNSEFNEIFTKNFKYINALYKIADEYSSLKTIPIPDLIKPDDIKIDNFNKEQVHKYIELFNYIIKYINDVTALISALLILKNPIKSEQNNNRKYRQNYTKLYNATKAVDKLEENVKTLKTAVDKLKTDVDNTQSVSKIINDRWLSDKTKELSQTQLELETAKNTLNTTTSEILELFQSEVNAIIIKFEKYLNLIEQLERSATIKKDKQQQQNNNKTITTTTNSKQQTTNSKQQQQQTATQQKQDNNLQKQDNNPTTTTTTDSNPTTTNSKDNNPQKQDNNPTTDSKQPKQTTTKSNQQNNECNITFGWFKDLFNDAKMIELLDFSQEQEITPPDSFLNESGQFIPENVFESIKYNKKCNAEFIKIEFIPFFLQVYVKLIENLKGGGGGGASNEPVKTQPVTVKETNNSNNGANPETIKPNTTASQINNPLANSTNSSSAEVAAATAAAANNETTKPTATANPADSANSSSAEVAAATAAAAAAATIKQTGGAKDYDEDEEEKNRLRELLLFNIEVLRTLNMYANPMFFDDLYYYYYFLSLDKIFPNIDSFFRLLSPSDSESGSGSGEKSKQQMNLRNSKTNVKMRLYEQFPNYVNQNPTNKNKDGKHYGYEIDEIRKDDDPSNFDLFLNLVQLKPEFNYMNPVVAEVEKEFLFNEIPVDEEKTDQVIAKAQVVNTDQKGGDFGFGLATSTYTYLDDAPLARKLEDVFKDEHATYDGNVHMCIYSLDKSCDFDGNGPTPFLKFIATKSGGDKWGFPSFHYTSLQDPDENDASFKCELFDHLMKTLEIHLCSETRGGGDIPPVKQEQPPLDDSTGQPEPKPLDDSTGKQEPKPLDDSTGKPEPKHLAKEKCAQIESSLDSMFIGIATIPDRGTRVEIEGLTREDLSSKVNVREEINGTPQLFAFLNYDFLETIVQTPENQAQTDLLFCRNADAKIYPIADTNIDSPLKWAIVDELLFEKKIMGEEVDPAIFDGFSKHHNLWNIEDENHNYIRFPFSVFAVEIDDANKFKTITVEKSEEEHPVVQIDHYGTGTMVDEYGPRYCFTISPLDAINPRRYAMFAWNTRYIITDENQSEPNQDTPTETGGTIFLDSHPLKLELDDDDDATSGEPDSAKLKDAIANEKLEFPTIYTITQNEYTDKPVITWGILNETQFVQL